MNDALKQALTRAGWASGTFKGFLRTHRAGIDWEVGQPVGLDRLELRYRYRGTTTSADGDVPLPPDATITNIEDAMTGVYLRVHEKPDPSRVFGSNRKRRPMLASVAPTEAVEPLVPVRQITLDLD